ncbi:MAG: leucine-rich repeat domain-containing protein [Lachnospiraceae bacterium]|nr:leucine-rich repeat domain-containing protein [Lachnospiraceae bacterium]MCM1236209.1 leucine-rich repeat domain-containing protein [Ruminococcus flavefaciens]
MKRTKKLLTAVFMACLVIAGVLSISQTAKAADGDFVIENGVLTKYNGSGGDVVIPDGVTKIGEFAFSACSSLTSVIIPNSVTEIGYDAFYGCSSLTNVIIPDSVTEIGGVYTFFGTPWLDSKRKERADHLVIINNILVDGEQASGDVVIPDGVVKIGDYAFFGCDNMTNITIPDSVTEIGSVVFRECDGLTNITIPKSVTKIGADTFRYCEKLGHITILNKDTHLIETNEDGSFYACVFGKTRFIQMPLSLLFYMDILAPPHRNWLT